MKQIHYIIRQKIHTIKLTIFKNVFYLNVGRKLFLQQVLGGLFRFIQVPL
jgi:hypothetical protein